MLYPAELRGQNFLCLFSPLPAARQPAKWAKLRDRGLCATGTGFCIHAEECEGGMKFGPTLPPLVLRASESLQGARESVNLVLLTLT